MPRVDNKKKKNKKNNELITENKRGKNTTNLLQFLKVKSIKNLVKIIIIG